MSLERDPRVDEGLRRLEAALRGDDAPVVDHFRSGRPPGEVAARLEEAGLSPTSDLLSWFGWHDGCTSFESYGPERGFLGMHPFLGLDELLTWRAGDSGRFLLAHESEMRGWQPDGVLPFLTDLNGGTVGYAVRDGDRQRVWLGFLEVPEYVAYGTLADFVEVLATAWERDVIRYDIEANELVHDDEALERLRTGHRPPNRPKTARRAPSKSSAPPPEWDEMLLAWRQRVDPTVGVEGLEMPADWPARQGASEEQLAGLERRLGRRLPPSYKSFLARTDGVDAELDRPARHDRSHPGFDGFLAADRVDVVGVADPLVLLDGLPPAEEVPPAPAGAALATWSLRGARTRFQPLLAHLPHCVVACASRGTAVYLDPLTVDGDGEWETWAWDEQRFARHRSFGELVQHKLTHPHAVTPIMRPVDPEAQVIWDLARRAEHGEPEEARQALDRLLAVVEGPPSTRRGWALEELARSGSSEMGQAFAACLGRRLDDAQVVAFASDRPGAWTRQPGARDLVVQILLRRPTMATSFGLWWPAALEDAYRTSGNPHLLDSLVFLRRPGAAGEARRRIDAGITDTASLSALERALAHLAAYPVERDLAGSLRDAVGVGGSGALGEVPSEPAQQQALELLEGIFVLRKGWPGNRTTLRAPTEVLAAAADLVRDALRRRPSNDLRRLAGLLGDVSTLSTLADDTEGRDAEIDLALEVAAATAPAARSQATEVLARRAAEGRPRAADALARLGDVRSVDAPADTPLDRVRRAAYVAAPDRLGLLQAVLREPDADDDSAVTAALGLVRSAFRTPDPFTGVTEACQALAWREDAATKKLRTHWRRIRQHLDVRA